MTTYLDIANQIKNRTDLTPSSFVTPAELLEAINSSSAAQHGMIAENWGADYLLTETYLQGAAGSESLPLPSDFYKLIALDWKTGDGYAPVKRWEVSERNLSRASNIPGATYRLWYVPRYVNATSLAETFPEALQLQNWHEWVVLDVCIKAHVKQEVDPSPYMAQKAEVEARITKQSSHRDAAEPYTLLSDRDNWCDPWSGGYSNQHPVYQPECSPVKYRLHGNTLRLQPTNYWGWR